jgi:hypothetical protein
MRSYGFDAVVETFGGYYDLSVDFFNQARFMLSRRNVPYDAFGQFANASDILAQSIIEPPQLYLQEVEWIAFDIALQHNALMELYQQSVDRMESLNSDVRDVVQVHLMHLIETIAEAREEENQSQQALATLVSQFDQQVVDA